MGFQEINALNAISLVAGAGMENIDAWNTCIDCALNCKAMPEGYTAAQVRSHVLTPVMHQVLRAVLVAYGMFFHQYL